jgi:hypothetical protein
MPISEVERRLLRVLILREIAPSEWNEIEVKLTDYVWRGADHAVVYEAIVRARKRDPKRWREELPAQTTRMGFPDVGWNALYEPTPPITGEAQLHRLIRELKLAANRQA